MIEMFETVSYVFSTALGLAILFELAYRFLPIWDDFGDGEE